MRRRPIIERLPEETRSTLRSTQILTSMPQLVSELVQNSLDAGARQVDIGIDTEAWACWVQDDGCGIPREGLNLLAQGKEKGRYGTSKTYGGSTLHASSTFGFRGEALASAIDLASVEISSRTAQSEGSWSIIVRGGSKIFAGQALRWRRERPGTIVNIKDAFYNLPVRRLSHPTPVTTLQLVKRNIENTALMFPHVGFTLENGTSERGDGASKTRLLTIVKTASTLAAFSQLFGKALIQNVEIVNEKAGNITIEGFLSLEGSRSRSYQFLYVNRHPVTSCDLHSVIDAKFSATSFGRKALDESGEPAPHAPSRRSPRKGERYPVYVLNIGVPSNSLDVTLVPAKTEAYFEDGETVVNFLGETVENFLTRNGFPPHGSRKPPQAEVAAILPAPAKRRRLDESLGEARRLVLPVGSEDNKAQTNGISTKRNAGRESIQAPAIAFPESDIVGDDCWIPWHDPTTGELYLINTRSGHSARQDPGNERVGEQEGEGGALPSGASSLVDRRWLRGTSGVVHEMNTSEWMSSIFKAWPNPTFDLLTGDQAPIADTRRFEHLDDNCTMQAEHRPSMKMLSRIFEAGAVGNPLDMSHGRLSKAGLTQAKVIAQVDRKFIACRAPLSTTAEHDADDMLLLIDQHAADERIRVEGFLRDMCLCFLHHCDSFCVAIRELEPPKSIAVTQQDAAFLQSHPQATELLERWGFKLSVSPVPFAQRRSDSEESAATLSIASIPDVVAVKLLLGDELREVVKSFIAKLQDEGMDAVPAIRSRGVDINDPTDTGNIIWMKALRWCPKELIDLVNSRACRGAIMFNDSLKRHQCEQLVRQLSECALPFQCAHGRPSMVPLMQLRNVSKERLLEPVDWKRFQRMEM
ncbi:hypothetical protein CALVIDRAFT_54148 [Calocera viscosa TUFC12733]|uniref:MutL C-terminal dimerisation domain-containing protein n=1 Tax=Calocera viscosa (strain TUFC12733) TaxID=1330018 RepID=A0A167NVG6_CALVF|nr:hypothetical protein CALVIDRAFT_54148 [Calocera viscosa TUFC12733]